MELSVNRYEHKLILSFEQYKEAIVMLLEWELAIGFQIEHHPFGMFICCWKE